MPNEPPPTTTWHSEDQRSENAPFPLNTIARDGIGPTMMDQPDNHATNQSVPTASGQQEIGEIKTVRLPQPFWRSNPARYFTVAEMTFALHRITSDESKFRYVIINLDADLLSIVGDIVDSPPPSGKYEALKQRIIDSLSESQETKLRRLLRGQAMGNDKPSVYLQRIRNLAGGQCNDNVLRSLFMEQLPEHVRGILAISQLDDLSTLAAQADRITEVMHPQISALKQEATGTVALCTTKANSASSPTGHNQEVLELKQAIEALTKRFNRAFRGRSRSRSRGGNDRRARDRSTTPHDDKEEKICYYHRRFGNNARNCKHPCSWDTKQDTKREN
ncbi:uncharacterized protein LOC118646499 [Monomorium pharaonis]|uniref:uncharacterized protein LOC118646499 n=1 Tax=Monomorium pharaonis TaxID=307658 RepID=UPI0017466DDC|nr:uncharacterized protein LOC118646499 [Monomorium pharaonis]